MTGRFVKIIPSQSPPPSLQMLNYPHRGEKIHNIKHLSLVAKLGKMGGVSSGVSRSSVVLSHDLCVNDKFQCGDLRFAQVRFHFRLVAVRSSNYHVYLWGQDWVLWSLLH